MTEHNFFVLLFLLAVNSVNHEICVIILFSRIALKDILATRTIRESPDLPISVINRVIWQFRDTLFSRNFAYAKFRENKTLAKISEFTVLGNFACFFVIC